MSLLGASFSAVLQQQAAAIATQQVVTQTVQATAVQVVDPVSNTPEPIASTALVITRVVIIRRFIIHTMSVVDTNFNDNH